MEQELKTFICLKGNNFWHEIDYERMRLWNYHCGWCEINENSEEYMYGQICKAKDWRDLYLKTGWYPFESNINTNRPTNFDCWIRPDGLLIWCDSHEVPADQILEIFYGEESKWAGDTLIEKGWIKASCCFWDMHLSYMNYWFMTQAQADSLKYWCDFVRIDYPEDIIRVR